MKRKNLDIVKRVTSKGVFPYQFAFTLLVPLRNVFLSPKKLVHRLGLRRDYNVLEVGSGPGYFSFKVAEAIPFGRLTVTDIQKEMLDLTKKRMHRKKASNVDYHWSNGIDFPFENHTFNVIFMVTVLGEIENKQKYIKEFYRLLRPNGILSISEQAGDPDKMSVHEINLLLQNSGFEYDKVYGTKNNFTINFRKND